MNNTLNRQRENMCQCGCHCHCMNNEFINKSDVLSEINTQNPNSDFPCSFYNNSPISNINGNYDSSNSPILYSRSPIREIKLDNYPLSFKNKTKSNNFFKYNSKCNKGKDFFNKYNTFEDIYTFKLNKNPLTRSMSSLSKNKFNGISSENLVLKNLLSKIPKHANSPFKKPYMNKRFYFNNNIYGKRNRNRNINAFLKDKNYQGFSSVVMPPNDLEKILLKSNANF